VTRRVRSIARALGVVLASGCGVFATEPDTSAVVGRYLLAELDGAPVSLDGQSELTLSPGGRDYRPFYDWRVVQGATALDEDVGSWHRDGDRVRLRSMRGRAEYDAAVTRGAEGAIHLSVRGRAGRTYTYRLVRGASAPLGYLRVAVVDTAGRQLPGGRLDFAEPDGFVQRAGTTEYAPYMTVGAPGEWRVTYVAPPGYETAPGQPNPVRVTVAAGQTADLRLVFVPMPR
jgi:hypothetical protein